MISSAPAISTAGGSSVCPLAGGGVIPLPPSIGAGRKRGHGKRRPCSKRRAAYRVAMNRDILNWFRFRLALILRERGLSFRNAAKLTGASSPLLSEMLSRFDQGGFAAVAPHLAEVFPDSEWYDPREMMGRGTRWQNVGSYFQSVESVFAQKP